MMGSLFSFNGRIGRLRYFMLALMQLLVLFVGIVVIIAAAPAEGQPPNLVAGVPFFLGIAVAAWVGLAACVKRLRDMGWPIVLGLVAVYFLPLFSLVLFFWPGKPADLDTAVFSDDPEPTRKRPAKGEAETPDWMQRALAQVSAPKQVAPAAPGAHAQPRVSGAMAATQGPRTEFGLRRW